jgi:hypothetical protein
MILQGIAEVQECFGAMKRGGGEIHLTGVRA